MPIDRPFASGKVMTAGAVIGVLWIAMALSSLWTAMRGYANERLGWGLAWLLVGVLLLGAGVAALVGTWWHLHRVRSANH